LDKELVNGTGSRPGNGVSQQAPAAAALSPAEQALVDRMAAVGPEEWFGIAKWAKSTSNLQGWQRKIAFSLGTYAATKRPPSIKQAVQGEKILDEARRLGFKLPPTDASDAAIRPRTVVASSTSCLGTALCDRE